MYQNEKKAIIIGCGIAGPVLSMALQKCGIHSTIYESQETPADHAGLYMHLGPNGVNVLKTLDVEEDIRNAGNYCSNMVFQNHKDEIVAEFNPNEDQKRYGSDGIIIKRGLFQKILRQQAESHNIKIEWGKKLVNIKTSDKIIAEFADGTTVQGDFVIGCDGIHSQTRKIIFPDGPIPKYTGVVVAGAVSQNQSKTPTNELSFHFGHKAYLNYFVTSEGDAMWGAHLKIDQNSLNGLKSISPEMWKQKILNLFKEDANYITDFIKNENNITKLPLYDLESLPEWYKGLVCLVGDSAHATTPHAGQGASLALESALTLAKCLRDIPNIQDAFTKYQSLRQPRVEKMISMARRQGEMFTVTSPIKKWFRNKILSFMMKRRSSSKMFDEIYGYKVKWDEKIK